MVEPRHGLVLVAGAAVAGVLACSAPPDRVTEAESAIAGVLAERVGVSNDDVIVTCPDDDLLAPGSELRCGVSIDGSGRVTAASLAESSGDSVLDAHALASVRGWRFAVPADRPDGFSGELPMRFTSGGQQAP